MRRLHLVFNVVKLTPSPANLIVGHLPPPPEVIDGEDSRGVLGGKNLGQQDVPRTTAVQNQVGRLPEHDSWEYATKGHAPDRIAEFYQKNPTVSRHIRAAIFSTIPFRPIYFEAKQS
jgi:hypothetical protein